MTTAREVVAAYLRDKAEHDRPAAQKMLVSDRSKEIIDELPDGFTARDVRTCVKVLTEGEPMLDDMSDNRRNRIVTLTLNDKVADGELTLDGDQYTHRPVA